MRSNPDHLILFKEDTKIIGHMIWHESNTEEHSSGDEREENDRVILRRLGGSGEEFVELHELWLIRERRGRGYGKLFFDFFEAFARQRKSRHIVFYAYDPAAVTICGKRGYRGEFGAMRDEKMFFALIFDPSWLIECSGELFL